MGKGTKIEWADHTFNVVWGCSEKFETIDDVEQMDPACRNCYARTFAKRVGQDVWGADKPRRVFGASHWDEPLKWNKAAEKAGERHRVFCSSMADVFEDHPEVAAQRERLWPLIAATPSLDWLLLTKRPESMLRFAPEAWRERWPSNAWAGATVPTQPFAELRIPHLLRVPAAVRFLSVEPMLGLIDLTDLVQAEGSCEHHYSALECDVEHEDDGDWNGATVSWVICGGESGPKSRPMDLAWVRSLRDQCVDAGVAFHFKQHGGVDKKAAGRMLDGRTWDELPKTTEKSK